MKIEVWKYWKLKKNPVGGFGGLLWQDFFYTLFLISIYFFKYETIVRSSAWSFGHLDPDPSSVIHEIAKKLNHLFQQNVLTFKTQKKMKL